MTDHNLPILLRKTQTCSHSISYCQQTLLATQRIHIKNHKDWRRLNNYQLPKTYAYGRWIWKSEMWYGLSKKLQWSEKTSLPNNSIQVEKKEQRRLVCLPGKVSFGCLHFIGRVKEEEFYPSPPKKKLVQGRCVNVN